MKSPFANAQDKRTYIGDDLSKASTHGNHAHTCTPLLRARGKLTKNTRTSHATQFTARAC